MVAIWWSEQESFVLSLPDYPADKLGWTLDTLAFGGRYFAAPTGNHPQNNWKWRFKVENWPAVKELVSRSGYELHEEKEN